VTRLGVEVKKNVMVTSVERRRRDVQERRCDGTAGGEDSSLGRRSNNELFRKDGWRREPKRKPIATDGSR